MKPAPEQLDRLIDMIKYENMTCLKYVKKQRENPVFANAYYTLHNALQAGEIIRPDKCEQCGKGGDVNGRT